MMDSHTAAVAARQESREKLGLAPDDPDAAFSVPFDVRTEASDSLGEVAGKAAFGAGFYAALEGRDVRDIRQSAWEAAWKGREVVVSAHPNNRAGQPSA